MDEKMKAESYLPIIFGSKFGEKNCFFFKIYKKKSKTYGTHCLKRFLDIHY